MEKSDIKSISKTGFCQQLFGSYRIVFIWSHSGVPKNGRNYWRSGRLAHALKNSVNNRVFINSIIQGLPNSNVLKNFAFHVETQINDAHTALTHHFNTVYALQSGNLRGRNGRDGMHFAGFQHHYTRSSFWHKLKSNGIQPGSTAPIIFISGHDELLTTLP